VPVTELGDTNQNISQEESPRGRKATSTARHGPKRTGRQQGFLRELIHVASPTKEGLYLKGKGKKGGSSVPTPGRWFIEGGDLVDCKLKQKGRQNGKTQGSAIEPIQRKRMGEDALKK